MISIDIPQYFRIAGITLQVIGLPSESIFPPIRTHFSVSEPGSDNIQIRHHIGLPEIDYDTLSRPVIRNALWEVYHQASKWIYLGVPVSDGESYHLVALFNDDHSLGDIYYPDDSVFRNKDTIPISIIPTDQILLSRVRLAYRQACLLHACGMVIQNQGLVFVGHSEAGKTTTARMLKDQGDLLCDDRIIIRRWPEGFRVHGTWSHGEIAEVSSGSAPLRAVFLLEKALENRLIQLDPSQVVRTLPQFVIKGVVTRDWWENILDTIAQLAREVPVYRLRLDRSGQLKPSYKTS